MCTVAQCSAPRALCALCDVLYKRLKILLLTYLLTFSWTVSQSINDKMLCLLLQRESVIPSRSVTVDAKFRRQAEVNMKLRVTHYPLKAVMNESLMCAKMYKLPENVNCSSFKAFKHSIESTYWFSVFLEGFKVTSVILLPRCPERCVIIIIYYCCYYYYYYYYY